MTTYLGKSCSFGLPHAFRKLPSIYVFSYFPFGFEGRMWDLIVSDPDHCLSFYFAFYKTGHFLRFSHVLLVIKLFFSASGFVKLIHNWELTFRILSCPFFFFVFVY